MTHDLSQPLVSHTPGPWHIGPRQFNDHLYEIRAEDGALVADTSFAGFPVGTEHSQDEAWADATLIAAAPSLLAALSDLIDNLDNTALPAFLSRPTVAAARAAIVLAGGPETRSTPTVADDDRYHVVPEGTCWTVKSPNGWFVARYEQRTHAEYVALSKNEEAGL